MSQPKLDKSPTVETRFRDDKPLCNAKKNTCGAFAMRGKTKCYNHGGATPAGIACANTKHGRYSKVLPARMIERYSAAINDPELLNLSAEIAVVDSRLSDLLVRVEQGDAGDIWDKLSKAKDKYREATLKSDIPTMSVQMDAMLSLIETGAQDVAAWREIHTVLEQRRRLVESERKRLIEQEQMLTLHETQTLFMALAEAVKSNVTDRDTLAKIQTEWTRLTGRADSAMLPGGGH